MGILGSWVVEAARAVTSPRTSRGSTGRGSARSSAGLSSLWLLRSLELCGPGKTRHETATAQECLSLVSVSSNKRSRFTFPNRGKGDYFRLGHGTDVHVRKPQMVEGLRGKKIVHVAVGALHCLAVTDTGQVLTFTIRLSTRAHSSNTLTYGHGTVPDE